MLNFQEWCRPESRYYDLAREFLTLELNAAIDGMFEGGATEILAVDGHGPGAINVKLLDPRVEVLRGWSDPVWPLCLDSSYDFVAWIGQHAKAGTPYGHLCHTQSLSCLDLSVNGVSIGEFGQLAMCASELGVRSIFVSGDAAMAAEAQALVPGIETATVKWGVKPGTGEDLNLEQYTLFIGSARHLHPVRARRVIREAACRAVQRAHVEKFGIIPLKAPFRLVVSVRPTPEKPYKTISRLAHPTSVIGLMNTSGGFTRMRQKATKIRAKAGRAGKSMRRR